MRKVIGIVIIIFGVGFLLQQMGVNGADKILSTWWPILIIGVGLMAWSSNRHAWFGPMIITLVGVISLLDTLHVFEQSAWNYFWPVIIIVIGLRFLGGKKWEGDKSQSTTSAEADTSVMFSGTDKIVTGKLDKADLSAWFGGIKLDLRSADIQDNAVVHVTAAFGGIEIMVPQNVKAINKVTGVFGGSENKTQATDTTKTLTITGTAIFGGVEIKN
jgi:predicted membrane protein